jgi:hypothetical protein
VDGSLSENLGQNYHIVLSGSFCINDPSIPLCPDKGNANNYEAGISGRDKRFAKFFSDALIVTASFIGCKVNT